VTLEKSPINESVFILGTLNFNAADCNFKKLTTREHFQFK